MQNSHTSRFTSGFDSLPGPARYLLGILLVVPVLPPLMLDYLALSSMLNNFLKQNRLTSYLSRDPFALPLAL